MIIILLVVVVVVEVEVVVVVVVMIMMIMIIILAPGRWDEWETWSACTCSCGGGDPARALALYCSLLHYACYQWATGVPEFPRSGCRVFRLAALALQCMGTWPQK